MKIVQMIYSLSSGGAEKFVVDLSNELSSIGHEIILLILLDDVQKSLIFNRQFTRKTLASIERQSGLLFR